MNTSNQKGAQFESEVRSILHDLHQTHQKSVTIAEKAPITLQNGEVVYPDFHLVITYPQERRHYLIECQNREHDSKSILHKIQHIRAKQALKTFFFIYPESIAPELARALEAEGIVHQNVAEFRQFVSDISGLLKATPAIQSPKAPMNYSPPDYAQRTIDYKREAEEHLIRQLNDFIKNQR
jgi:hypothetical protein